MKGPYNIEKLLRSSREADEKYLRHIFKPTPKPTKVEVLGFLALAFLGRCIVVGLPIYVGCYASLFIMGVFSSHSDALFGIGGPAAERATLYLSPIGAVIWCSISVYREVRTKSL